MSNPLASTTFTAGPKDTLAALDVYSANGANVINSIQTLASKAGLDLSKILGTNVSGILSTANGKISINKDALTSRLVGLNSSVKTAFSKLSASAQSGLTDNLVDSGSLIATIGGIQSKVSSVNFDSLNTFGTFINSYTSQPKNNNSLYSVDDEDGMACMISGMIGEGSSLGVTGIYSTLTDGIENPSLISKIIDQSVPTLVQNSDITTLFDMSIASGPVMSALFPNLTRNLTNFYTSTLSGFEKDPVGTFNKLISTLDNIDSGWSSTNRAGNVILNLLGFAGASPDLINLVKIGTSLMASDNNNKYMALAARYPATTVEAELHKFFPRTVLTTSFADQNQKKKTLNPIVNRVLGSIIEAGVKAATTG